MRLTAILILILEFTCMSILRTGEHLYSKNGEKSRKQRVSPQSVLHLQIVSKLGPTISINTSHHPLNLLLSSAYPGRQDLSVSCAEHISTTRRPVGCHGILQIDVQAHEACPCYSLKITAALLAAGHDRSGT